MLPIILGYILDLIFGDPYWLPHPVRWIGRLIMVLEDAIRPRMNTAKQLRVGGAIVAIVTVLVTTALAYGVLYGAGLIHPYLRFAVELWMVYTTLATCSLGTEAEKVRELLKEKDLDGARKQVAGLVSRDTATLDESGVARAAVETVAENFSDGVAAPLLFIMIGGPGLGMAYKAVNTLDSMLGYKNERYIDFGRFAAIMDDWVNWVPARLCSIFVVLGALWVKLSPQKSWRIFWRDRFNHASPNSGHPEAAFAGALGIQMGGPSVYFGELQQKPTIGDPEIPIVSKTIKKAYELLYASSFMAIVIMGAIRMGVEWAIK